MRYTQNIPLKTLNQYKKLFNTQGFVCLRSLFSSELVHYIKRKVNHSINAPIDKYQKGFNRIAFDLFKDDYNIFKLMKDPNFRHVLYAITNKELFYTQGLAFELKKNKSSGFPWHIGTQSFGYQKLEDFGCTIWMPLDVINTDTQRGGMAYVPENKLSGRFMYEYVDPLSANYIQTKQNPFLEEYLQFRDEPLNNKSMDTLLSYFASEDDFAIGDAILFNKFVIHRSVKLEAGELDTRGAFVMRFIDPGSTYDKNRAVDVESPREVFGYEGCSTFHLDVCNRQGEVIAESPYFNHKSERLLTIGV